MPVHRYSPPQVPLLPLVISKRAVRAAYSPAAYCFGPLAASAYTEPMIGAATLVPPKTSQPLRPLDGVLSYTHTPVLGSATAATSATVRSEHPTSCCQLGLAMYALQPLPEPLHTVSMALRVP